MKKLSLWLVSVAMLCISAVAFANTDYLTQPTFDPITFITVTLTADTSDPASAVAQSDTVPFTDSGGDLLYVMKPANGNRMYAYSELIPKSNVVTWSVCHDEPTIETPTKIPIAI